MVFNQRSEDLGGFVEEIDPHAFDGVDTSDVKLLYNHNSGDILARTSADTLTLTVDDKGLEFEASIPETTLGNDTITNIENRNVQGMSFGFTIDDEDWINQSDGTLLHIIRKVGKLYELSLTPFPAYKETDVAVSQRSMKKFLDNQNEFEVDKEWIQIQRDLNIKEL